MNDNNKNLVSQEIKIKLKLFRIIGKALGYSEPCNKERLIEFLFRMQIFFPELTIQRRHYFDKCFFEFFNEGQLYRLTHTDLNLPAKHSKVPKSHTESRQLFSTTMPDRKALLIRECIESGIMLLVQNESKNGRSDFMITPIFEIRGYYKRRIHDEDVFAKKISNEIFPDEV